MTESLDLGRRARAAGLHLSITVPLAVLGVELMFAVWYPGEYRLLAGGEGLFMLLVGVDLILGPLLTFAVFNIKKGWPHLRRDLAVIGMIQLAAFIYGMHTVFEARPVAMVFEVDRFRVITASQVHLSELTKARVAYTRLPMTGPWLLGTRKASSGTESNDAIFLGANGIDLAQRPSFWQPYSDSVNDALSRSRPLAVLLGKYPAFAAEVNDRLRLLEIDAHGARFLPVIARGDWVVILDRAGRLIHFVPVDGFF